LDYKNKIKEKIMKKNFLTVVIGLALSYNSLFAYGLMEIAECKGKGQGIGQVYNVLVIQGKISSKSELKNSLKNECYSCSRDSELVNICVGTALRYINMSNLKK
jgi:hypothetical protein